jgi:DNA-binding XRE family transcriptional regulator
MGFPLLLLFAFYLRLRFPCANVRAMNNVGGPERVGTPLERIRAALGLNRTELAALFGVRRQALDHWAANGVPAKRQEKLATVAGIVDLLSAKLKGDRIPGVVRRPSPAYGGRSALDAIAADDQELVLAELRDAFDWAAAA